MKLIESNVTHFTHPVWKVIYVYTYIHMCGGVMVCFFCFIVIFRSAQKKFPDFTHRHPRDGADLPIRQNLV